MDRNTGGTETIIRLPGYLRGLSFVDGYALVGLSKIRESNVFGGMPIQKEFRDLRCGIAVVDLNNRDQVGFFEFTEGASELYDLRFLPGIQKPNVLNTEKPEARRAIVAPEFSEWLADPVTG